MNALIEGLLDDVINIFYQIEINKLFVEENIDLIYRCIERAETIYEASLWEYAERQQFYFVGRF